MRIAMIGQKGFDVGEHGGGVERHVIELATRMGHLGHEVTVYTRQSVPQALPQGVTLQYLPSIQTKNLETVSHTLLATLHAMRQRYDIIHYHGVGPATFAWIPRLFARHSRVVVTFHSRDRFHAKWGKFARAYLTLGEWAAAWFPHVTITVSHVIAVYVRTVLKHQVVYIPNGALVRSVTQTQELEALHLSPKHYLLSVSRLVPHKGQHYLIEAFQQLQRTEPDLVAEFSLVIVGAETYGAEYQSQLSRLAQGNPKIRFLGFQDGEVLDQLFAHARLFVHASEFEGLPVVVLEAMSFGLPVLVSDIPENIEAIHHAGFSFASEQVPDLVQTLSSLLHHPERLDAAGEQARSVINTFFNWDTITEETLTTYRSIRH
ncbi:glycosyltransferase family 4 protein [Candidatus Uhrbacteria bacterium]|nr:glycosyltransferase family 4 protein [Candidatus Uhrbacteria bacterium]